MPKTVLVVDDSQVFRSLEVMFLQQRGYTVIQAGDGVAALKAVFEHKPDLVLLDVQLPVMDGVSVLATLKANPDTKKIPIIVITTIGREKDRDILLRGGADDFISKPITGPVLVAKVEKLLAASEPSS